jgi:hypothetical protein
MSLALALACIAIFAVAVVGQAQADPLNDGTRIIHLYNCTGPPGTPETFDGIKEPGNVVAFHIVGSTAMFRPVSLFEVGVGLAFDTPGFDYNAVELVTCNITRPSDGQLFVMEGFFTPAN